MKLFHYTCDHGRAGIGERGVLKPTRTFWGGPAVCWLTDMDPPDRDGLGLTSHTLSCDRLQYRYVVADSAGCERWLTSRIRAHAPLHAVLMLEAIDGVKPDRWWISTVGLRATLDNGYQNAQPVIAGAFR